jgi:hypothetical protein
MPRERGRKQLGFDEMHQSSQLHPEWGILVPPRSFARNVRILMIAAAVGITAGAGVMSSLAERSSEQPDIVAQTLVQPAVQQPAAKPLNVQAKAPRTAEIKATAAPVTRTQPVAAPAATQNQKKANKKHPGPRYAARGREFTSLMDDWYHAVGL